MSHSVIRTIDIAATPATVFRFLVDPEWFRRWMGASASMLTTGQFQVDHPNGDSVRGEIIERVEGHRVVYAWGYAEGRHGIAPGQSRVEITLEATAHGTRVNLHHSGLPSTESGQQHLLGWNFYTAALAANAASEQYAGALPALVASYVSAWKADDPREHLARSVVTDILYRDGMSWVQGREALAAHILATRAFARGLTLQSVGEPLQSHDVVVWNWVIHNAAGEAVVTGISSAELSPDGLFSRITGFWSR